MSYIPDVSEKSVFDKVGFQISFFVIAFIMGIGIIIVSIFSFLYTIGLWDLIFAIAIIVSGIGLIIFTIVIFVIYIKKYNIAKLVKSLADDENVDELISLLDINSIYVIYPILALGVLGSKAKKAVHLLLTKLTHKRSNIREETCYALGELKAKEAIPHLINIIDNETNIDVRVAAIYALSYFKKPFKDKVQGIIEKVRTNDEWNTHIDILLILAFLSVNEIIPIIKIELKKTNDVNKKFLYYYSLSVVEGIKGEAVQHLDELYVDGKIKRKWKKKYLKYCRVLIFHERNRKRRRKTSLDDDVKDIVVETKEMVNELTDRFKSFSMKQKTTEKNKWLRNIITTIIAGLFTILAVLLSHYLP